MSNFLAVATVTAALQRRLQGPIAAAVPGAAVWVDRPDVKRGDPGVTVYLYRTSYDPAWRNRELPVRGRDGSLVDVPRAALDLHYLLTFHGKDAELQPQRLLGAAAAALHTRPLIDRDLVEAVVAAAGGSPPVHSYLAASDLAAAVEIVRLCPDPLDLEELSKLWSVFFQTAYELSTTYVASVVLLEEDVEPSTPLPVRTPALAVRPLRRPRITRVTSAAGPAVPVVADTVLLIEGSGLLADATDVRVGGAELVPVRAAETRLEVDLASAPAGELRPGTVAVQVAHPWLVGSPPAERGEETSNVVTVPLHPRITASLAGGVLTVVSDLPVGAGQRAVIALLEPATGASVRIVEVPDRTSDTTTLTATLPGVPLAGYGVVLSVDGVDSLLTRDATGAITSPVVTVP